MKKEMSPMQKIKKINEPFKKKLKEAWKKVKAKTSK